MSLVNGVRGSLKNKDWRTGGEDALNTLPLREGVPMPAAGTAPQIGTCPEYERLLEDCQKALVSWQQQRTIGQRASFAGERASLQVRRLQANYARAYELLESHERTCGICQYVSKIGGLDFESMS